MKSLELGQVKKDLMVLRVLMVVTVVIVMVLFQVVEPKKVAALIASGMFLVCGGVILWRGLKWPGIAGKSFHLDKLIVLVDIIFLVCFSLPIIYLRLSNWNEDAFAQLQLFGITGAQFHQGSTYVFISMLLLMMIRARWN